MLGSRKKLLAAFFAAAVSGAAPSAMAATSTCWFGNPWWQSSCWTGSVAANAQSHHVGLSSDSYNWWNLYDSRNGVRVASGTAGFWPASRTVYGLYSSYRLHCGGLTNLSWCSVNNN